MDTSFHGRGSTSDFISDISCTGDEDRITDCAHSTAPVTDCNDVAVSCRGTYIDLKVELPVIEIFLFDQRQNALIGTLKHVYYCGGVLY